LKSGAEGGQSPGVKEIPFKTLAELKNATQGWKDARKGGA